MLEASSRARQRRVCSRWTTLASASRCVARRQQQKLGFPVRVSSHAISQCSWTSTDSACIQPALCRPPCSGTRPVLPQPPALSSMSLDGCSKPVHVRCCAAEQQPRSVLNGSDRFRSRRCRTSLPPQHTLLAPPPVLRLQIKEQYLHCLKQHGQDTEACRDLAKEYLKCRMDRCGAW